MVPILLSRAPRALTNAPTRSASALAPGVPAALDPDFRERFGVAAARRLRLDRDQFRHRLHAPGRSARARWARVVDGFRGARRRRAGQRAAATARPVSWCCAPTSRLPSRPAISACPRRPSRPGGISGSTPAIGLCATPSGYFRFVDRLKDAIRRRGENISSYEVEQVLLAHPDIAEAAVFPGALGAGRG